MDYRQVGQSGLRASAIGLGCNGFGDRLDQEQSTAVVTAALEAGITLFDTADMYGHPHGLGEEMLGHALANRRDDAIISTKFGSDVRPLNGADWGARGSRRYIRKAIEGSLRRLGTEWIDLYQLHTPDPMTPVAETLAALSELVVEGKVRHIGCCNFSSWELTDADWTGRTAGTERFVSVQDRYSLLARQAEAELVPACLKLGTGLLAYSPLEYGLLTGNYRRNAELPVGSRLARADHKAKLAAADFDRLEALENLASNAGVNMLHLAIGGLLAQPGVSVLLVGAELPEQVKANAAAAEFRPPEDVLAAIDQLANPCRNVPYRWLESGARTAGWVLTLV